MSGRAAVRLFTDPLTAGETFEPATTGPVSSSGSTVYTSSESIESEQPKNKWVNLALASILTVAPVNILGPIDVYNRRQGAASVICDWFDEDIDDDFLIRGGLIIPTPERKILFRKTLRLERLEKRKPYLSF